MRKRNKEKMPKMPTQKEIKRLNFEIEQALNTPEIIIWSVIEELRDIQEFYISNIWDYLRYKNKANEHLLHQIDRLNNLLTAMER